MLEARAHERYQEAYPGAIERIWVEPDGTEGRYAAAIAGVSPTDSLVSSESTNQWYAHDGGDPAAIWFSRSMLAVRSL